MSIRTDLEKMVSKLKALQDRAEDWCQSENQDTAYKYDKVCDILEEATGALEECLEELKK